MKIFILLLPVLLFGTTMKELIKDIDKNLLVKSQNKQIEAMKYLVEDAKSKQRPKIDVDITAVKLEETPTAVFYIPHFPPFDVPVGTKNNVTALVGFSYPLFSGFAISANIEKSKLELIKKRLQRDNLKRELYLKTVELYSALYSINHAISAAKQAKKSIQNSLKVAKGMYENDLLGVSKLYNIEAKKYEVEASLQKLIYQKKILKERLFYLTRKKVDKVSLNRVNMKLNLKKSIKTALKDREDIRVIKKDLGILDEDLKLVKSGYYPKVALVGAVKRESDDFGLGSNGFTNPNKNYVGINLNWNLYNGSSTSSQKEAIKAKKTAMIFYLRDYQQKVKTDIKALFWNLKSLKSMLKASKKEIKAQKKYLQLTKAKFKNSLVSSDELSRAILLYYQAIAKKDDISSKIFLTKYKIKLQTGLKNF